MFNNNKKPLRAKDYKGSLVISNYIREEKGRGRERESLIIIKAPYIKDNK